MVSSHCVLKGKTKAEVNLPPRPWNILKLACVTALWVKSIKSEFNQWFLQYFTASLCVGKFLIQTRSAKIFPYS